MFSGQVVLITMTCAAVRSPVGRTRSENEMETGESPNGLATCASRTASRKVANLAGCFSTKDTISTIREAGIGGAPEGFAGLLVMNIEAEGQGNLPDSR